MSLHHAIWTVGTSPTPLPTDSLASESTLEEMIVAAPGILSSEWMLIGRQEDTGLGGRIDLLAVAPDASLVLIELKRGRTPRDVVAQALDYASWVGRLEPREIAQIYARFARGRDLAADFRERFGQSLDDDTLNQSHQIVVVASTLDESTERIVQYLSERDIAINVLCFQVFTHRGVQLLSRAWLIDPIQAQSAAASPAIGPNEPWNGEFYASFGENEDRVWDDAMRYGFISAGGGPWYSRTLQLLGPGDRVWVKIPGRGFVGVGRVEGKAVPITEFRVKENGKENGAEVPILKASIRGRYMSGPPSDPERCEYFVPMRWLQVVPSVNAIQEVGMFGNQNSVCRPTTASWRETVERLKVRFPQHDESVGQGG